MGVRIDFYHDAADKLAVAAKIAQKAQAAGQRVLVVAPDAQLREAFDRVLWTFAPLAFVPHVRAGHVLEPETPVILSDRVVDASGDKPSVLLNLGSETPKGFEAFERLIEIVSREEADKGPARLRFREYRDAGLEITSHRLGDRA